MVIKAVIFDVDGVLMNSFEANLKFFQDLMIKAGYEPPTRAQYLRIFHLTMMEVIRILTKSESEGEIKRIWRMGSSRAIGYPLELIRLPDDAEAVLEELSQKYHLAIATGRVRNSVYEYPGLAKLKRYFRTYVCYEDTEKHKPDPEPLQLVARRLGVKPSECVYIGDAENDVKAARAAGMSCIFYSKQESKDADACTSSFSALPGIIASL